MFLPTQKTKELNDCIACGSHNLHPVLDLGNQPLANSYKKTKDEAEDSFPLAIQVCADCSHTQLTESVNPDLLFKNYLYVSGTSKTQLEYCDWFAQFTLEYINTAYNQPQVLDIGCNDGSQLDSYKKLLCNTFGIDPAENLYPTSSAKHTVVCDYLTDKAVDMGKFDIILCQNAFAHNFDQEGFMKITKQMLKDNGYLFITTSQADMILNGEFDTIYHEHLSFYTIKSMNALCRRTGLNLVDVVKHPIHGNSFIFVISATRSRPYHVENLINFEKTTGLHDLKTYTKYNNNAISNANQLKRFIEQVRDLDDTIPIVGFGAPAKGNTLMNYIGIGPDFIIDENPLKQGLFTPGVGVPIYGMDYLKQFDDIESLCFLPLAWNFFTEIKSKIEKVRPNHKDVFIKYFPKLEVSGWDEFTWKKYPNHIMHQGV